MLATATTAFAVACWLGLYLLARDPAKPLLRRAGAGLLAYALALACMILGSADPRGAPALLGQLQALLTFLPALAWSGAVIALLPESPGRERLDQLWAYGLAPLSGSALVLAALAGALGGPAPAAPTVYAGLSALVLLPLAGALLLLARAGRALRPRGLGWLLGAATLFFLLSTALLLLPLLAWLPRELLMLGLGGDLGLLGFAVAAGDAFDEGERLRPDMLRSLLGAGAAALLFGGQVGLAIALAGATPALVALLLTCVAAAIAAQVLAAPIQGLLDRLAFARAPEIRRARAELRADAAALPRLDPGLDLAGLDEAELARLTRRALSHMGDLPRLASSPLTRLPLVSERLAARGAPDQPLERAGELRAILAESIERLRPRDGAAFGTSDAWRHYNALYFPYVVGLRPYSQRADHSHLDATARQALDWLAAQVPERTLHNWQNAAARLIAQEIRAAHG